MIFFGPHPKLSRFSYILATGNGSVNAMSAMKNKKGTEHDDISHYLLRQNRNSVLGPICTLVNISMESDTSPDVHQRKFADI